MKYTKKTKLSGFSLIELLVVLAIVGILAGLLFPAVQNAITAARQLRDVNNARGIAMALIMESMDSAGFFRLGLTADHADTNSTSLEVFQGLLNDEIVDDPAIFYGYGAKVADSYILEEQHIGFQYIAGYSDSANSRLPLVITKGTGLQKSDLLSKSIPAGSSAWGNAGVAVAFVGGNAEWVKNSGDSEDTLTFERPLGIAKSVPNVVVYD